MSEYAAVPSTGKLKLKGVQDGRIDKKKKKKSKASTTKAEGDDTEHKSVILRQLEDEDAKLREEANDEKDLPQNDGSGHKEDDEDIREHLKTEAEKRYDEQRRKRLEKRLEKEGVKTHKQRVEELNKYLSNLSEHHDMPKIGPG